MTYQVISWFFTRNPPDQKGVVRYISSDEREKSTIKNTRASKTVIQIWQRNQKLYSQVEPRRIQHH